MIYASVGRGLKGGVLTRMLGLGLVAACLQAHSATFSVINTNDTGSGSLRQAITDANASPGTNIIEFHIPGNPPFTIAPHSTLPPITPYPVTIDATTQAGYAGNPVVEINGTALGANGDGLYLLAGNSAVRGLAINRCKRDGIRVEGLGGNVIQGNFLGTGVFGTNALGNAVGGITVYRSSGNLIGGTNAAARNVISGGAQAGLFITGPASNNIVQGNYIGLSCAGAAPLGNKTNGITLSATTQNLIGGSAPGAGNVISGNSQSGIYFLSGANSNQAQGNIIGLNAAGSGALSNSADGITINGANGNVIGGAEAGMGNVISGNNSCGVTIANSGASNNVIAGNFIGTDTAGKIALGNGTNGVAIMATTGNTIGGLGAGARNVISGNQQAGVLIAQGASNNVVQQNFIGLNATGTNALANAGYGIVLMSVSQNTIGGAAQGAGNVISGNTKWGIYIYGSGGGTNFVQGNLIGTDANGKAAIANALDGMRVDVPGNVIGGTDPLAGNVISGNASGGIYIYGSAASNNVVQGNHIGADITGGSALGNTSAGIIISNAPGTIIGGTASGAGNLISANLDAGINIGGATAKGGLVQGNFIGTDTTGQKALGNSGGIYIYGSPSNTIGGIAAGAGNLISGNSMCGISLGDAGATGNVIQGNFIGTKIDGLSALGNAWHNIDVLSNGNSTVIGGTIPAANNRIAFTKTAGYDGIRIRDGATNVFIGGNSIFSNGNASTNGLGIDVSADGVTTNGLPVLTAAMSGANTVICGSINTNAGKSVLLQFYANTAVNVSGYGEGMNYLGSQTVVTDTKGSATFTAVFPVAVPAGQFITATATVTNSSTSEFSRAIQVAAGPLMNVSLPTVLVAITNRHGGTNLFYVPTNSSYTLSWPTNAFAFSIWQTTNLAPPINWTLLTNVPTQSGASNQLNLPTTNAASQFFQLRFP